MIYPISQQYRIRGGEYLSSHKFNISLFLWTMFSLLLTPSLPLPGLPSIRLDDIIIIFWVFFVYPFLTVSINQTAKLRIYFFVSLGLLLPVSIVNGLLSGYGGGLADLNQYIRYIKYVGVYLLALHVFNTISLNGLRRIFNIFFLFSCILSIIAICQYIDLFELNEKYVMFVGSTHGETLVGGYPFPRPIGMIGNPNELAFIFVLIVLLSMFHFNQYGANVFSIGTAVFAFIGLVLTMSRGGIVGLIAGLLLMGLFFLKKSSLKIKFQIIFFTLLLFVTIFAVLTYPPIFDQITWRLVIDQDISTDASWMQRQEAWTQNLEIIEQHYILGVGPLRRQEFLAADNEWLLMMRSYGMVGVVLFVSFMMLPLFSRSSAYKKALSIGIVSATFLYMIPTVAFHSVVLFPLILILFAFVDYNTISSRASKMV